MFKNYFKTALRNLRKNKLYSCINIFGLTVGLAACLLIGVYINHELSYDKFNVNAEQNCTGNNGIFTGGNSEHYCHNRN